MAQLAKKPSFTRIFCALLKFWTILSIQYSSKTIIPSYVWQNNYFIGWIFITIVSGKFLTFHSIQQAVEQIKKSSNQIGGNFISLFKGEKAKQKNTFSVMVSWVSLWYNFNFFARIAVIYQLCSWIDFASNFTLQ